MIFSECPNCDEPQTFGWECGDPGGWFPSRCQKCEKVMWVEATSIAGETLSHETFKATVMKPGDEAEIDAAAESADVRSMVVYAKT